MENAKPQDKSYLSIWFEAAFPRAWAVAESVSGLLGLIALSVTKNHPTWGTTMTDLGWQVPIGAFVLIFVYRAVTAPAEIYKAQRTTIDANEGVIHSLRDVLEGKRKNARLAELLGKKDEWAVHNLWAKIPKTAEEIASWKASEEVWRNEVGALMDEHGCPYLVKKSFLVLGNLLEGTPPGLLVLYHEDSDMNKELMMLNLRRKRLQEIIESYAG